MEKFRPFYDLVMNYSTKLFVMRIGHKVKIYVGIYTTREKAEEAYNSFKDKDVLETFKMIYFFQPDNNVLLINKRENDYKLCSCGMSIPKPFMDKHLTTEEHLRGDMAKSQIFMGVYTDTMPRFRCEECKRDYSIFYKNTHYKTKLHLKNANRA